jgi:hypothetical protein
MMLDRADFSNDPLIPRTDIYISVDVETDGPIPGPYSLLAFGMAVAGTYDGRTFTRASPQERTFYVEIRPISDQWQPEAMAVNGLDRETLVRSGADPVDAMNRAAEWIDEIAAGRRPVLVAYPVAYDWSFLYWYFVRFARHGSPFGHSSCFDIRTLYAARAGTVFDRSGKRSMPAELRSVKPHTHNALEDALEQADLFANVFEWSRLATTSSAGYD